MTIEGLGFLVLIILAAVVGAVCRLRSEEVNGPGREHDREIDRADRLPVEPVAIPRWALSSER
ncbi:hypothetical protein [Kitasatospora sp. NPDC091207]|uniref:hypothetical protein n=1 Tax=Kitasatospora sp. NPDC091207 TaxID=3364083 RepID=UPI0038150B01